MRTTVVTAALALGLLATAAPASPGEAAAASPLRPSVRAGPDRLPPEQQRRYALAVQKCGRCHSMDVSFDHQYTLPEWRASLRRMIKLPGSAITEAQAEEILEYIRYSAARGARK